MALRKPASSRAWQASYSARVMTGAAAAPGTCDKISAEAASQQMPARRGSGLPRNVCNEASVRGPDGSEHMGIAARRSEEHTSELQSLRHLVCRLLLEK